MAYTTIDDASAHFQTVTYTGNAGTNNIVNDGNSDLQPDWVWIKNTSTGGKDHGLFDSSRGTTKQLNTNNTNAENTVSTSLTAFNSDGFTLGADGGPNANSDSHVAWQWKANGGTTTSQTGSDIDSVTQANTTSKFAIITYTGASNADSDSDNNSGAYWRVKHGLGSTPKLAIFKNRSNAAGWYVWHHKLGGTLDYKYIQLQGNNAVQTESAVLFGNTDWSSTEFEIGAWNVVNRDSQTYVAYMFDEVQGYSKFGSYTGNNNANGTFVYTGFKPAWLMLKNYDDSGSTANWYMFDNKRDTDNVVQNIIHPNANDAASDSAVCDFLSNGFKFRTADNAWNGNGDDYIYMAFAESPFVSSEGVPTTAR